MSKKNFKIELAKNTMSLVTSSFGLVAALAWNEVIKEVIDKFVRPFLGGSSGLISLVIYALLVTFLAVFITYNLSKITEKRG